MCACVHTQLYMLQSTNYRNCTDAWDRMVCREQPLLFYPYLQKSFLDLVNPNQIWIVIAIFLKILHQSIGKW